MSFADVLPPSPPTTSSRKVPLNLPPTLPLRSTPEDSTTSAHENSSLGSRKRVGFHPVANVHHSSDPGSSSHQALEVKRLPPSRECQSSNRPILKVKAQCDQEGGEIEGPMHAATSLNEAMESVVQQLCSDDKTVLVGAYRKLASTMRTCDELPDKAVMKTKLSLLTKQIRLHLAAPQKPNPSPVDSNLLTSALKVTVILVWSPDISPLLNDDFRLFLADRAIQVIVDHTAPKNVVMHYLHLLATQDFRSSIMTSNQRASRLIDALGTLDEHYKGNGPASERLMVYAKLIDQARSVMKAKAAVWIEPMLMGMCSGIPAVGVKALELGRKACQAFPPTNSICSQIRQALEPKQQDEGASTMCLKLERLLSNRDTESALVPQIWAVVLLLANHPTSPIEKWPQLKEWLVVIQRCFNGSDPALRQQAYLAWNRFVFIARPHQASESLMTMLVKPIIAQLERPREKASKGSHALAVSTYCNLLYYVFRPATTHSQYTKGWNEYIVKVLRPSLFEKNPANADIAARILMALLWDSRVATKVWNMNRAHENRPVEPEELPTIDCKWIRSKCEGVISIFEVLFRYSSWGLLGSSDQAFISKAWRHLLRAIRDAGSKEIKTSKDMYSAIMAITGLIARLWAQGDVSIPEGKGKSQLSTQALHTLTRLTVTEIGPSSILELLDQSPHMRHCPLLRQILTTLIQDQMLQGPGTETTLPEPLSKCVKVMANSLVLTDSKEEASGPNDLNWQARELCQVLECLPTQLLLPCLALLSPCLASWLQDEGKCLSDKAALHDVCVSIFKVIGTVPPSCVADLDDVFAAAFTSTHSTTVNFVATLWNRHFGDDPNLKIGTKLEQAISRLRPYMELQLPFMTDSGEEDEAAASLPVYETQAQFSPRFGAAGVKATMFVEEMELLPVRETGELKKEAAVMREGSAREKKRHDDSQINFVTVESSPLVQEMDSQLLTERQKEVLERQRTEPAVVFADIRSSPRPRSSRSWSRDCEFARKAASMPQRPATPTLPDVHDAEEIDAEPSPTPRARPRRAIEEADIPSSPPSMQRRRAERAEGSIDMSTPLAEPAEFELDSPTKGKDATTRTVKEEARLNVGSPMQIDDDGDVGMVSVGEEPNEGRLEGHIEEAAQVQTPSSQVTSDELEEMSASQLTHDLARSQVIDNMGEQARQDEETSKGPAVQSTGIDSKKGVSEESEPEGPVAVETPSRSRSLRKRKRAPTELEDKGRRRRRRKTGSSQGQSQPVAAQSSDHELDTNAEIHDEIVAFSSPAESTGSRSHTRASRRQPWRISLPRIHKNGAVDISSSQTEEPPPPQIEAGMRDSEMQTDEQEILPPAQMDLLSSLRQSLELAKNAVKGGFVLRAVADLCFEIQHVATLRAGSENARAE
ncbi:hypothetical protein DV738_g3963, partial [Chaetothyriales sp. CBS 135597]